MELYCTSRILNTTNVVVSTPIPLIITEEDMTHSSIAELEHQARLAWIYEQLNSIDCECEVLSSGHYRLYFTSDAYRHLSYSSKVFIADCNRLPWLKVELIVEKPEHDHPKFNRSSLRNEDEN